ncbi:formate/nitrite transporter family protein, partial [Neisseria sp. P0021.S004]
MVCFFGCCVGFVGGLVVVGVVVVAGVGVGVDFGCAFVFVVACNWMVCMGIWFYFGARHISGRVLAVWFFVMVFV